MCGICGFVSQRAAPDEAHHLLGQMCEAMVHRGPDDLGVFFESPVGLAMRRLSIIDLEGGHQPMRTADGAFGIVFNGELYNYRSLRSELASMGHDFHTESDTEVLLQAYVAWGPDCLPRLNGMFAFAIWDEPRQRLFLARDRLGQKPLYYYSRDGELFFASELKSLLVHAAIERRVDSVGLDLYLTLGYVPAPWTLFAGIRKLPPASSMVVAPGREPRVSRYWQPSFGSHASERSDESWIEELGALLRDSARMRMVADVPVGVLLSGGVDSSAVTACVAPSDTTQPALHSFSVGFAERGLDEASAARLAARHIGTEHHELRIDGCSPDRFQHVIWHCDEPVADPALVPTSIVCELARQHVKVVLTGEGADELLAGYFYHRLAAQAARLDRMPASARKGLLVPLAASVNRLLGRTRFHPRTLWAWRMSSAGRSLAWQAIFTDADKTRLGLPAATDLAQRRPGGAAEALFEATGRESGSPHWLDRCLYVDMKLPLADGLLMKVDKMSMAASLEARSPFLDHRLVELACSMPPRLKLGPEANKLALRQAVAGVLPPETSAREKHGFHTPLRRWLQRDLRELALDRFHTGSFAQSGILGTQTVDRLEVELDEGFAGSERHWWSLLCLAEWQACYRVAAPA